MTTQENSRITTILGKGITSRKVGFLKKCIYSRIKCNEEVARNFHCIYRSIHHTIAYFSFARTELKLNVGCNVIFIS